MVPGRSRRDFLRALGKGHPQYAKLHRALEAHIRKASREPWQRPEG